MKVSTGLYATKFIPGNYVTKALADLQVAVRANPGFAVICIRADAGLGDVVNASFDFAATQPESNGAEI